MTTTITLQDATASDLTQALAHPVPPPNPNPQPPSTVTAPFQISAAQPFCTIVQGPDGPLMEMSWDSTTKTPWLYITSYYDADTRQGQYPGCFLQFRAKNTAGTMMSAVNLNAGFCGNVAGKENGDLDVGFLVDGVSSVISLTGHWTPPGTTSPAPAGIMVGPPDTMYVGTSVDRFLGVGMKIGPVRPGMPANAIGSVEVQGVGYIAVFR